MDSAEHIWSKLQFQNFTSAYGPYINLETDVCKIYRDGFLIELKQNVQEKSNFILSKRAAVEDIISKKPTYFEGFFLTWNDRFNWIKPEDYS